jgi:hypothetical protein
MMNKVTNLLFLLSELCRGDFIGDKSLATVWSQTEAYLIMP